MAMYEHQSIEKKWQQRWEAQSTYEVKNDFSNPKKFYVLDMFPYPSGAGLHVGHPLGYIASDIVARYKTLKGFQVLHPMGFDAFGLPAEQYAIDTGQHPAVTTEKNIVTFKKQLAKIGFSFDWTREVRTSDPAFYRWTQWIFGQLFGSWYNRRTNKAEPIAQLVAHFAEGGSAAVSAVSDEDAAVFTAAEWAGFSARKQQEILLQYRLTYPAEALVNWCPALGSVLANDEVKDGFSERGGYPVERKKMKQWMMRITAYADRLLANLAQLHWSEPLKEMQRNWIGKSLGCELDFVAAQANLTLTVFTTRPDTVFGVTYLVLAPEHSQIPQLTSSAQKKAVETYVRSAKNRSERDRISDTKTISGVFTGSYAQNPFNGERIPIWVADYVLAGYGTGVVMAVPAADDRDYRFARHFSLPIRCVIEGTEAMENPTEKKDGRLINSGFLNGLYGEKISGEGTGEAVRAAIGKAEEKKIGRAKVNYKMRDAVFSRQRYWGEPVPVYFDDEGLPRLVPEAQLPLRLPAVDAYKPTETGEPPLRRASHWKFDGKFDYEHTTMPGWAGSSWYALRYMDPKNEAFFVGKDAVNYWKSVDLYIGGTEHAVGHLLYARFWHLFLYDMGFLPEAEPFKKLVNQGMIQGRSSFVHKVKQAHKFVSQGLAKHYDTTPMHTDIGFVHNDVLDIEAFKKWRPEYADAEFELENGKFLCTWAIEKMSKSKYNVVNPDDVIEKYGADTLRMYEMFLGPLEASKPWSTDGIEGVRKFLHKLWQLFHDKSGNFSVSPQKPSAEALKVLHKTIKKVEEDIENLSLNTAISAFMVCVNDLSRLKCNKSAVLEDLLVVLSPFAPHIAEELWEKLGHQDSITKATFPVWNAAYLKEDTVEYPISVNGKVRTKIRFGAEESKEDIERKTLENDVIRKWLEGKTPKKVIVVPKRIVNIVV